MKDHISHFNPLSFSSLSRGNKQSEYVDGHLVDFVLEALIKGSRKGLMPGWTTRDLSQ